MNNPHIAALIYKIEHGPSVDYRKAESIDHEEAGFRVKIVTDQVRFELKEHYATEGAARKAIEDYIRVWEFSACLENGPDCFRLNFERAWIEDRNPTPGVKDASLTIRAGTPTVTIRATVDKHYPPPPSGLKITPDVQTMYDRYRGYRQGREPLTTMVYFCLTIIEDNPTTIKDVSSKARDKIRHLSSGKGGQQARKASGKDTDLTAQDRLFLEEAIKAVIRRAAERAHAPDSDLPKISLSDLPALSSDSKNQ